MKKLAVIVIILVVLAMAAFIGASVAYSSSSDFRSDSFPENTTINGVDCSGLTYDEAEAKLTEAWNDKHIIITGKLSETVADFTDLGCTYDIADALRSAKDDNKLRAAANHFLGSPLNISFPMTVDTYSEDFKERVITSPFLKQDEARASEDAYVDITDPDFPIVPEVYGDKPDADKFFADLIHHIQTGEIKFTYDEQQYYSMPKVTSEDKELKEYQEYCRKYLTQEITYELGVETFTLTSEQLNSLLKDDMSGEADEEAVEKYVASLAEKYDNVGITRNFTSLSGKQISVSGGSYGWTIDQKKEAAQLTADINSHKDVSREPVFSVSGYGEYSADVGDTYIDVDISAQTVRYYRNGALVFNSPCVTGHRNNGTTTYTGTFYILNKVRNVVLRGENVDGSKYESPVKYWLGFWGPQGFHDADWRGSFGGSIWINDGSHGCINMPPSLMPSLYNSVEVGMPVVLHY